MPFPKPVAKMSLLLFIYSLLLLAEFSNPFQYQTLQLKPLQIPHPTTPTEENEIGDTSISLQLHHIDSLISLNATPESLFNLSLQRDAKRVKCLFWRFCPFFWRSNGGFNTSVTSKQAKATGEYYALIGIGTPPVQTHMILDTGSDITWMQCAPCKNCFHQMDPLFDTTRSKSYSAVACDSTLCRRLVDSDCDNRTNSCTYKIRYRDGSKTMGDFATETLTFGKKIIPNVAFGCGRNNEGTFSGNAAGIIGLGRGNLSLIDQIGPTFKNKFSYCLVDRSSTPKPSILIFGNSAVYRSANYTPLLTNPIHKRSYYLDLLGISIGGHRVPEISPQMFKFDPTTGKGGVIIDSGTSVTRLNNEAYIFLRDAFRYYMSVLKKPVKEYSLLNTCYELAGIKDVKVPNIVLHFNGVDLALPPRNYFIPVGTDKLFCFAIAPSPPEQKTIIGNIMLMGFRIIYDLAGSRIGFSKYNTLCENIN